MNENNWKVVICQVMPFDLWLWRNPLPQGNTLRSAAYGNGKYVAVGQYGTIMTSLDGINWTLQFSGTSIYLTGVAFGAGLFVAVGMLGTILTSADGENWTRQDSGTDAGLTAYVMVRTCLWP
ncbi:WD40/YVTN/BNR-like repeat-containing protein [Syntrophomonas palmitatica]|uniref:WD40/YVTN/BNR-like repeat-containing protein n=1 Tax=Syntrophomonas palmitatica TaxID=402877 RepID=UPI001A9A3FD9|nr:hypothetical protein [Syntrophomonas palmitatica]